MLELARPEDRERIQVLRRQVHALHCGWRPETFRMEEDLYPEAEFLADIRERQVYAAKAEGEILGYVRLCIREFSETGLVPRRVLLVNELCVEESRRDLGIGTQMMQEVWAIARAFGCSHMKLGVQPENNAAVALYRKCGFHIASIHMEREV